MLSNQYKILQGIDKKNAKHYVMLQKIIEDGFTIQYGRLFDNITDNEVDRDKCALVQDVLDMYATLQRYESSSGRKLDGLWARFSGFDGNEETEYMSYARFVVEEQDRWTYLKIKDFNAHTTTVPTYKRMVEAWRSLPPERRVHPSEADVAAILDAAGGS